jgi:hypothetical protein
MREQVQQPDGHSVTKSAFTGVAALTAIGIATGAAAIYLLRTERGREFSADVRKTISDSVGQFREKLNESVSSVRESITELANRWNRGEQQPESENLSKLRRVV